MFPVLSKHSTQKCVGQRSGYLVVGSFAVKLERLCVIRSVRRHCDSAMSQLFYLRRAGVAKIN